MLKIKAEGRCHFCNKMYKSAGITRHLSGHLNNQEKGSAARSRAFHVKVAGGPLYFLHLLMHEKLTLGHLDEYLRRIWLECCGHMSSFQIKENRIIPDWDAEEFGINKKRAIGKVLREDTILEYEYDFGSMTYLEIKTVGVYQLDVPREILLLSRNEPLPLLCHKCEEKPAVEFCTMWHEEEKIFCEKCAKLHAKECEDFADYAAMPLVNSPRTGVCGYQGGVIDKERDGVWQGA